MKAYCWGSGRIQFTEKTTIPNGALLIATLPGRRLRKIVASLARHGMGASKGILFVPGVPEAEATGADPIKALIRFTEKVKSHFPESAKGKESR